jgi:hypothetical protein
MIICSVVSHWDPIQLEVTSAIPIGMFWQEINILRMMHLRLHEFSRVFVNNVENRSSADILNRICYKMITQNNFNIDFLNNAKKFAEK